GSELDNFYNLATDTFGNIYLVGYTNSTTNIASPGAHQQVFGGAYDLFLTKFHNEDTLVYIKPGFADTSICVGDTVHVPYGVTNPFRSNNVFTLQLSNASGSFASPVTLTTLAVNTGGMIVA